MPLDTKNDQDMRARSSDDGSGQVPRGLTLLLGALDVSLQISRNDILSKDRHRLGVKTR